MQVPKIWKPTRNMDQLTTAKMVEEVVRPTTSTPSMVQVSDIVVVVVVVVVVIESC